MENTHSFRKIGENKPGTFEIGSVVVGHYNIQPIEGLSFKFIHTNGTRYRITSVVEKIIPLLGEGIEIETMNSTYRLLPL